MSYKNQMKKRKKISRKFAKKIEKTKKLRNYQELKLKMLGNKNRFKKWSLKKFEEKYSYATTLDLRTLI